MADLDFDVYCHARAHAYTHAHANAHAYACACAHAQSNRSSIQIWSQELRVYGCSAMDTIGYLLPTIMNSSRGVA